LTGAGTFPFDPQKLADLAAFSRSLCAQGAPPPIGTPVVIDERGYAWMPTPRGEANVVIASFAHLGLRIGWSPMPELEGMLLTQWGGQQAEPELGEQGVTAFMTRDGLRRYIADLQAIDAALGDG